MVVSSTDFEVAAAIYELSNFRQDRLTITTRKFESIFDLDELMQHLRNANYTFEYRFPIIPSELLPLNSLRNSKFESEVFHTKQSVGFAASVSG